MFGSYGYGYRCQVTRVQCWCAILEWSMTWSLGWQRHIQEPFFQTNWHCKTFPPSSFKKDQKNFANEVPNRKITVGINNKINKIENKNTSYHDLFLEAWVGHEAIFHPHHPFHMWHSTSKEPPGKLPLLPRQRCWSVWDALAIQWSCTWELQRCYQSGKLNKY